MAPWATWAYIKALPIPDSPSRIVWQTQKRITTEILELRGLRQGFEVVLPVVSLLSEDFSSILSARAIP